MTAQFGNSLLGSVTCQGASSEGGTGSFDQQVHSWQSPLPGNEKGKHQAAKGSSLRRCDLDNSSVKRHPCGRRQQTLQRLNELHRCHRTLCDIATYDRFFNQNGVTLFPTSRS